MRLLLAIAVMGSLSVPAHAQDIDKLLDAQNKSAKTTSTVDASVNKTANESAQAVAKRHAELEQRRREMAAAAAADKAQDSGATANAAGTSSTARVAAIRSESYDNAGRQTTAYWIECHSGNKTRIYRSAWDGKRDWYSPAGFGTFSFIASASLSVEEVAQKLCR